MITPEEVTLLSTYSRSELIGGLILAQWARHTKDNFLRGKLTHHAAEEITHADYFVQLLEKLGHQPLEVHDEQGNQYYHLVGIPKNELEVLVMADALEPVALHHYIAYTQVDGVNSEVKKTLEKIIGEEEGHADWVDEWLANYPDQKMVKAAKEHYKGAIDQAYDEELRRLEKSGGMLEKLAKKARELLYLNESGQKSR